MLLESPVAEYASVYHGVYCIHVIVAFRALMYLLTYLLTYLLIYFVMHPLSH